MNRRALTLFAAVCVCLGVGAQEALKPEAFAHRWNVRSTQAIDPAGAALWLELPEAVHAQATSDALLDVAAFNAAGERLTFAPLPTLTHRPSEWRDAAIFALPGALDAGQGGAQVRMSLGSDGRIVVEGSTGGDRSLADASSTAREWILDSGAEQGPRSGFRLRFDAGAEVSAAVSLEASDDLQQWRMLVPSADVLQLRQQSQLLQRLGAEHPADSARYYRLRHLQGQPLALQGVSFEFQDAEQLRFATTRRWQALRCAAQEAGREWVCDLPARLPLDRLEVRLPVNVVAAFDLDRREDDSRAWRRYAQITSFDLRGMGTQARSDPLEWWGGSSGQIRLRADSALSAAPEVRVGWRPAAWLLLTRGPEPYAVVAGLGAMRDPHPPVDAMLTQIRLRQPKDWSPPKAELVDAGVLAGEGARRADSPQDRRNLWLWAVLGLGVFVVGFMVFRLLRESKSPS